MPHAPVKKPHAPPTRRVYPKDMWSVAAKASTIRNPLSQMVQACPPVIVCISPYNLCYIPHGRRPMTGHPNHIQDLGQLGIRDMPPFIHPIAEGGFSSQNALKHDPILCGQGPLLSPLMIHGVIGSGHITAIGEKPASKK